MSEWISVDERLPEPKTMCLVRSEGQTEICYFSPLSKFAIEVLYGKKVTHWMPLPEPPEVKS